jgi:hypothetical protein
MRIIYDLANGRFQSPSVQDITTPPGDERIPAPATRLSEPSPPGMEARPDAWTIHLILALLGKR